MSAFDLSAFSDAIADIAEKAAPLTASLARGHLTASAFHWRDGLYVTAEEALDDGDTVELTLAGGETLAGELAGRDPSTGVALIRTGGNGAPVFEKADMPRTGSIVVAVGQKGELPLASFGAVGLVGPAWRSMRGGEIARSINLAISAGGRFEGGPVLDAKGALLGMLLFGPRRHQVLVMPHENIESAVAGLSEKGHVARGYLGASLHPVRHGGVRGAMVMGLDEDGPAQQAGIKLGDIIAAWNGEAVNGPRELLRRLGPASAGKAVVLGIVRGGEALDVTLAVGEKPLV